MSTTFIVNIAIEVFSSVLCFIFIVCILIADDPKLPINKAFIRLLLANIGVMLSDALAFYSIGKTEPLFYVTNYLGNYCTYLFSYFILMALSDYLVTYLSTKATVKRSSAYASYIVLGVAIVLSVVALFNDMYFVIDENNIYHRQGMYWLSQILGIVSMLINAGVIIKHRKFLNRMELFALSTYIVFPVVAVIIQMSVYGFVSVYIASTLSIVIIYVGMQVQQAQANELALSKSRMAIMLSQIHPHFLYNTLVSISELCDIEPAQAKEMTLAFSRYLRGNMDSLGQVDPIPFEKELEHVKNYLLIEKKRFEERLAVKFDIKSCNFTIPALTLQPIVENAIRHGVTKRQRGGTVTISTEEAADCWYVKVADDGVGFDPEKPKADNRSHIGIENVRGRLRTTCGGSLKIDSTPGAGTAVTITIPKEPVVNYSPAVSEKKRNKSYTGSI